MEWKISKGQGVCCGCEKTFQEMELTYSTLESEEDQINRYDFCTDCFEKKEEGDKEVFWRTRNTVVKTVKKAVNFEVLRDLFHKMLNVDEKAFKELNYLLGLVLIRKRYLRLKDFITENGIDIMTVQQKKGEPVLKVEVPLLGEDDIALLRDQLSLLLDADLDSTMEINELRETIQHSQAAQASKEVSLPEPEASPQEDASTPQEA